MRKIAASLFLFFVFNPFVVAAQIPDGVKYEVASEEINQLTHQKIFSSISGGTIHIENLTEGNFTTRGLVVGHFLSSQLNLGKGAFKSLKKMKTVLPFSKDMKVDMDGYRIRDTNALHEFSTVFDEAFRLSSDYKIRKLTPEEMTLVWFFIGWDLDEPIFIVEDANHQLVIDFSSDGKQLDWIEDIKHMSFYLAFGNVGNEGKTNCYRPVVVGQGTKLAVAFEECKETN